MRLLLAIISYDLAVCVAICYDNLFDKHLVISRGPGTAYENMRTYLKLVCDDISRVKVFSVDNLGIDVSGS